MSLLLTFSYHPIRSRPGASHRPTARASSVRRGTRSALVGPRATVAFVRSVLVLACASLGCTGVSNAPPDASALPDSSLDGALDGRGTVDAIPDADADSCPGTTRCTFDGQNWTCSCGGGTYSECWWLYEGGFDEAGQPPPCTTEGATCYDCYYESAGFGCTCRPMDGGLRWWCLPSGNACTGM